MSFKFQLPNLTETMSNQQLRSYLTQMVDQLEYALNNLETDNFTVSTKEKLDKPAEEAKASVSEAVATLKDMIVKNAEVIRSEMDSIETNLHGEYEALSSTFGAYREDADARITQNANGITTAFTNISSIDSKYDTITGDTNRRIDETDGEVNTNTVFRQRTDAYIKSGKLYYEEGIPIFGVAVGQITKVEVGGEELILRQGTYSVFTSQELAFYKDDKKIAYVANDRMHIIDAEVEKSLKIGEYIFEERDDDLVIRYGG